MASGSITSWQIDGKTMEKWETLFLGGYFCNSLFFYLIVSFFVIWWFPLIVCFHSFPFRFAGSIAGFQFMINMRFIYWSITVSAWKSLSSKTQAGIKVSGRNINNLRCADDTTLTAESKERKSLLMKVREESEKFDLKLNIQKNKITASCPIPSLHGK